MTVKHNLKSWFSIILFHGSKNQKWRLNIIWNHGSTKSEILVQYNLKSWFNIIKIHGLKNNTSWFNKIWNHGSSWSKTMVQSKYQMMIESFTIRWGQLLGYHTLVKPWTFSVNSVVYLWNYSWIIYEISGDFTDNRPQKYSSTREKFHLSKISYVMLFYEISICKVVIFSLYTVYNKHDMIKIGNQTRKKWQVLSQVFE